MTVPANYGTEYRPPAYKASCQLAAIDWNKHMHLPQAVTKEGKLR